MAIANSGVWWAILLTVAWGSPGAPSPPQIPSPPERLPFLASATIQDLMDAEIDPSADFIWASVGTVITKDGIDERQPRSAAEWKEVRRRAITLIGATNLLLLPHRRVAIPAFPSIAPGVLGSDEIQLKLNGNRAAFNALALTLRQAGLRVLQAIDRRDVPALSRAGEALDSACEACHIANWYPHQVIPSPSHFPPAQ